MSTTKHLILTERPGTHIEIVNVDGRPAIIVTDNYKSTMAYFEPADGAKTALAILGAAGGRDSLGIDVGNAMTDLREYVNEKERATAAAKEQAELEAEALELHKAAYPAHADWEWESVANPDKWLAVARKAREMAKESTNGSK